MAEREFCPAPLGDVHRVKQLIQLAQQHGVSPNASTPQGCGSHAATKAAYRFYGNDAIEPEATKESIILTDTCNTVITTLLANKSSDSESPCPFLLS